MVILTLNKLWSIISMVCIKQETERKIQTRQTRGVFMDTPNHGYLHAAESSQGVII
jgi:hypothetical protein